MKSIAINNRWYCTMNARSQKLNSAIARFAISLHVKTFACDQIVASVASPGGAGGGPPRVTPFVFFFLLRPKTH